MAGYFVVRIQSIQLRSLPTDSQEEVKGVEGAIRIRNTATVTVRIDAYNDYKGSVSLSYTCEGTNGPDPAISPTFGTAFLNNTNTYKEFPVTVTGDGGLQFHFTVEATGQPGEYDTDSSPGTIS